MKKGTHKKNNSSKQEQRYEDGQRRRKLKPIGKKPKYKLQGFMLELVTTHFWSFS